MTKTFFVVVLLALGTVDLGGCAANPTHFSTAERRALLLNKCYLPAAKDWHRQMGCYGAEQVNGRKEGLWCCFDSAKKIVMAGEFHAGLKNGRTELYAPGDGHLESISSWNDGQLEGPQIGFFKNGNVANEFFILRNKFDGEMRDYDESGHLLSIGHYKNGQRHGLYQEWDTRGVLIREENDQ